MLVFREISGGLAAGSQLFTICSFLLPNQGLMSCLITFHTFAWRMCKLHMCNFHSCSLASTSSSISSGVFYSAVKSLLCLLVCTTLSSSSSHTLYPFLVSFFCFKYTPQIFYSLLSLSTMSIYFKLLNRRTS